MRSIMLTALAVLTFQGCAIVSSGHSVPVNRLSDFKPGETTPPQVVAALGPPENVAENTMDRTMVYSYHWLTDRFLGIGLPPFLIMGRKSDNGFQLNVAFLGGVYQGYTLTQLDQNLLWRDSRTPEPTMKDAPSMTESSSSEFKDPRRVEILGYADTAMEPFISRDGRFLFFNNSNDPSVDTNIFYAKRIDDLHFRFMGPVEGVNAKGLDGVASMDNAGRFYFTSVRDYAKTYATIFSGDFQNGKVSDLRHVPGDYSRKKPGWITMDVEVSADGDAMYFSDAFFNKGPIPARSHLGLARRSADGAFMVREGDKEILRNVNSAGDLEYAPSISRDGLELYFTRLTLRNLNARILRAKRAGTSAPFNAPERIAAAEGFVEAPSISGDGKTLFFHKKEESKFYIYRAIRD